MAYTHLAEFVAHLENNNELHRVKEFVSPYLEIAEVTDRITKSKGKALLFENNGTSFPVLINAFGSEKRTCMAFGIQQLDDIALELNTLFHEITQPKRTFTEKLKLLFFLKNVSSWLPAHKKGRGICQEVIMPEADLTKLPILTCWPLDGGPFITLPVVHTIDPETGKKNMGMYRMQVFGKNLTGMHWHLHKNSAGHFRKYKALGLRMPVSVTLGGDPAYTYAATAPLPDNVDENILVGFLRKKKVKLVKCLTNDLEVPEDVDFVIEGYIDPNEDLLYEGPFGDHTGFYSLPDYYPAFHVTCITHKKNAIYPATIVGIPPQEDEWLGKATERFFLPAIQQTMQPEIEDMLMPVEGAFHNLVICKVKSYFHGQAQKLIHGLWGAGQMMFTKITIAVDVDANLSDYTTLMKYISLHLNVTEDVMISKGPADVLEHAAEKFAYGGKLGMMVCGKADSTILLPIIDHDLIKQKYASVLGIYTRFVDDDISLLVLQVDKNDVTNALELGANLIQESIIQKVKCVVMIDKMVDVANHKMLAWLVLSNIDPARDVRIVNNTLVVDATFKVGAGDTFERLWPNIIVMDDKTIAEIDNKWNSLGLGSFISSPSLQYKQLVMSDKAYVEKRK